MSRFKPSPALVVSAIALFMALGGTSYAAFTVGTSQIKNGAVTTKKIKNGAVTQAKLGSGLAVANANHANTANAANNANSATNANNANHANSADNANHANNADNATNAGNSNTVDGQTLTNVNVNVAESGNQQVYNANGLSVTVLCSSAGEPTINVNGPNQAELNWSGQDGSTAFGGLDPNIANIADDVTSAHGRGNGTFAASTFSPAHTLSGNLSWDDTPTHGSAFTGCSVWGTLISS